MRIKSAVFWIILVLFISSACWWVTYFPYNPERLYRAVPMSSEVILELPRLSENWKDIAEGPLSLRIAKYFNVSDQTYNAVISDARIDRLISILASRQTLFANVPYLLGSKKSTLIISSWAGTKGQLLKWSLPFVLKGQAERKHLDNGADIWVLKKVVDEDMYLSFAIVEGVFLGCLSLDPEGVKYLVDRIVNGRQVLPVFGKILSAGVDAGVLENPCIYYQGVNWPGTQVARIITEDDNEKGFAGKVVWELGNPFHRLLIPDNYTKNCIEGVNILGDTPALLLAAPMSYMERVIKQNDPRGKLKFLVDVLIGKVDSETPVLVSLCKNEYKGKIRGLGAPSLVAAMRLKDVSAVMEDISTSVDRLNMEYKWGLFAPVGEYKGHKTFVLNKVSGMFFQGLGEREKPTVTVIGNWLIIGSNLDIVESLVDMDQGIPDLVRVASAGQSLFLWTDFQAIKGVAVNFIALNDLVAYDRKISKKTKFRSGWNTVQILSEILTEAGTGNIRTVTGESGQPEMLFEIGTGPVEK